jgi:hypothetical protein
MIKESKPVNGASHLQPRDGTYYFYRRVPEPVQRLFSTLSADKENGLPPEIVAYFKGKRVIRFSLKTKDKKEATRLCVEEDFKFNSYEAKLEQWLTSGTPIFDTASNDSIKGLAQLWLSRALQDDEERRLEGFSAQRREMEEEGFLHFEDDLRAFLTDSSGKPLAFIDKIADDILSEFQLMLDRSGPSYRLLQRELVKGWLHMIGVIHGRNRGHDLETPKAPSVATIKSGKAPVSANASMTLDEALDYWKKQSAGRGWKTIYDAEKSVKEFKALHGPDITIDQITKTQVIAYRDWLLGIGVPEKDHKPLSRATIEKRLAMLKAPLQVAVENDKLPFNPVSGVKVAETASVTSDEDREPFTLGELRKIFTSPIYSQGWRDTNRYAGGEAQYWIPLLMLYTGLRREETGQLLKTDIQQDEGTGVWFIYAKAGNGKRL